MIFLTGPHASGKTMISKMIFLYGFLCIELGTTLRLKHKETDPELNFSSWCQKEEKIHGPNFTDNIIVEKIRQKTKEALSLSNMFQDLVIVGSRSYQGIQYISNRIPSKNNYKNTIIYIDAPLEILKKRYYLREKSEINDTEFDLLLEKDCQIGIKTIVPHADFVIWNNSSEEKIKNTIEKTLFSDLQYTKK